MDLKNEHEHAIIIQTTNERDEPVDVCNCGARWSHPKSRTQEERNKIFLAHIAYFNRPKTRVD